MASLTFHLFKHDVAKNYVVIALLGLLFVSSVAMIYFSSPLPNQDIPIKITPTPTPILPTPQISNPTSTPTTVINPTPPGTRNPETSSTPTGYVYCEWLAMLLPIFPWRAPGGEDRHSRSSGRCSRCSFHRPVTSQRCIWHWQY